MAFVPDTIPSTGRFVPDAPDLDTKHDRIGGGRGVVNPKPVKVPMESINVLGFPEAALSLGSAASGRFAGLVAAGLGAMVPGQEGQAQRWLKGTQDALTYRPRTDVGRDIIGSLGDAASWVANQPVVKKAGEAVDYIGEKSPVAGAALHAVPDILGLVGMRKPLFAASDAITAKATGAAQSAAHKLMYSAVKPTLSQHASGDAKIAVDNLLKYGINPTRGGVEKLGDMLDDINRQIAEKIKASNAVISRDKVSTYLDPVRRKFANQVNPTPDLRAIGNVAADFELRAPNIPVQQAQALKQGTYRVLKGKYGEEGVASTEAQKGLARGLKEEVAAAVPEVAELNALDSQLIKTLSVAERRALMDLNKNPMGLSILAHSPSTVAAFMADKSTLFKSLVARMLNRMSGGEKPSVPRTSVSAEFNPLLAYGVSDSPAIPKPAAVNPLGDTIPDWATSLGATGGRRAQGVDAKGMYPAVGEPPLVPPSMRTVDYAPKPLSSMPDVSFVKEPALQGLLRDWTTSPGATPPKQTGGLLDAGPMYRALGEEVVPNSRLKGRPQMPVVPGLPGVGDTIITGRAKNGPWADAASPPTPQSRLAAAPMASGGIELSKLINMPKSGQRTKLLNEFKKRYPEAAKYIEENQ
jgi:hypothetical protein